MNTRWRVVAVVLVLANLGYFAWSQGAFSAFGFQPARFTEREPHRLDASTSRCGPSCCRSARRPDRPRGVQASSSKRTVTRVPGGCSPGWALSRCTVAPCWRAISRTIGRPRPEPSASLPSTR